MPHIIIEHSKNLHDRVDFPSLLKNLHETLAAQGIDQSRIKTRNICLEHSIVGDHGADGMMIHTTLLLLEGRDIPTKTSYGQALYDVMKAAAPERCAVTLEVRDMIKETYFL